MRISGYSKSILLEKTGFIKDMEIRLVGLPNDYFSLLSAGIRGQVVKNGSTAYRMVLRPQNEK